MSDNEPPVNQPDVLRAGIEALRENVTVRREWRARLLAEIDAQPLPLGTDTRSARGSPRGRSLVLSPALALAAAMGFMLLGAGTVYLMLRDRAEAPAALADASPAASTGTDSAMGASLVTVRFTLEAPDARRVALVGDFNHWNAGATPMQRTRDGQRWVIEVGLHPGRHAYAFVVDDNVVADPAAPSAVGEDFGVRSSVVLVSERAR